MYYDQPSSYDAALYAEADMTVDFVLPDGRCNFVEEHYPDYFRSQSICLSGDMEACFEYAELDGNELITDESVGRLKAQAPDKERSTEPSWYQVHAFDDFIGSGKTFKQAADELNDYCLAKSIRNYPTDAPKLPDWYYRWADSVLSGEMLA